MTSSSPPIITGGTPEEWSRALESARVVAFWYRTISPWVPLGIGAIIVWGSLDWFRMYWPPTDWRAGWVLTPLLLVVGVLFLVNAVQRFKAADAPAQVDAQGFSGQKLALVTWDDVQDVRWVTAMVGRGIYVVVRPEVFARPPTPATLWDRFGRFVQARSWNPDE